MPMWGPNVTFVNPIFLYGLLIIPLLIVWYMRRSQEDIADLRYSTLRPFADMRPTLKERLHHLPFVLRLAVIVFLIVALARPQTSSSAENVYTEGIDIVLLLDISGSMLAEDFSAQPHRGGEGGCAGFHRRPESTTGSASSSSPARVSRNVR